MSASILQSTSFALPTARPSSAVRWTSRVMTTIFALFLAMDASMKLFLMKAAVEGSAAVGIQPHHLVTIGILQVICLALYLIPRTSVLGAVLWTGYFGGAVLTNLRADMPLYTHILSPVYCATFMWIALYLRDARVRGMIAPRQ